LDDQGRADAAIECLRKALRIAPDYADAMFSYIHPDQNCEFRWAVDGVR
jgi:hypothetical protein